MLKTAATKNYEDKFISLDIPYFIISAAHGQGVDSLVTAVAKFAEGIFDAEPGLVTRERHRQLMSFASGALAEGIGLSDRADAAGAGEELIAEQVRLATRSLERLLGRVDVEDVLDVIFRDFCIGK